MAGGGAHEAEQRAPGHIRARVLNGDVRVVVAPLGHEALDVVLRGHKGLVLEPVAAADRRGKRDGGGRALAVVKHAQVLPLQDHEVCDALSGACTATRKPSQPVGWLVFTRTCTVAGSSGARASTASTT